MCKSAVKYFNHINFLNYYSAEGQFIGIYLLVAGFFVCGRMGRFNKELY